MDDTGTTATAHDGGRRSRARRRRRLSTPRVLLALAVAGLAGLGIATGIGRALETRPDLPDAWSAPYVDATLTPLFGFEDPATNPSADIVLSFVVADPEEGCVPTWGGYYGLDEAATALDLDRRIARFRQHEGDVVVSFGGAINDELAVTCEDDDALVAAYREVVDRYGLTTLDLDIEGDALTDEASSQRRARAIAALQAERRSDGLDLAVWLTLPVAPRGMPGEAVRVIDDVLAAGVDLAGVNLMTMNFGSERGDATMGEASIAALEAAHRQLDGAYRRAELPLTSEQVWRKLGATPMIGRNDLDGDVFDLDDAEALVAFSEQRGLGRMSLWSLNRDAPCGPNVDPRRTSDHCTGLEPDPLAFTAVLDRFAGRPADHADAVTVPDDAPPIVDDPETSPYPIWRADRGFDADAKVVWRGNVYQAKWWNQGEPPDAPIVHEWETPWRLIGPVLPDDRPVPTPTPLPEGTYPDWRPTATYEKGDRVQVGGYAYEAKWWTKGDPPDAEVPNSWDTPWEPLFDRYGG